MKNIGVFISIGIFIIGVIAGAGKLIAETSNHESRIGKLEDKVDTVEEKAERVEIKQEAIKEDTQSIEKKQEQIETKIDQIVQLLLEQRKEKR